MVLSRHCTVLIWIASLALLWSYQVQGAEVDDSLSYIDTFDYLGGPEGGEYEYEPFLDIPETTKPTVTSPTEPANPGNPPKQPEPEPEPEPVPVPPPTAVVPPITIEQGNITVPAAANITNTIISNMPNTTEAMAPQPMIPEAVQAVSPEPVQVVSPATVPQSPPSSSSSWIVSMPLILGLFATLWQ